MSAKVEKKFGILFCCVCYWAQ